LVYNLTFREVPDWDKEIDLDAMIKNTPAILGTSPYELGKLELD
jgi:hypothetical protein